MAAKPTRAREPIQVYLDGRDRALLDRLSKEASVPRSEILRMGLRRLGHDVGGTKGGTGLRALIGVIDGDVPSDLAARHDDYLYPAAKAPRRTRQKRKSR